MCSAECRQQVFEGAGWTHAGTMAMPNAHRAIMMRRAEEERIERHVAAARQRDKAMVMAHFEERTTQRIEQRKMRDRVGRAKAELDADLDRRRRRYVAACWVVFMRTVATSWRGQPGH